MRLPPGLALPAHSSSPARHPRAGSARPARKTAPPAPPPGGAESRLPPLREVATAARRASGTGRSRPPHGRPPPPTVAPGPPRPVGTDRSRRAGAAARSGRSQPRPPFNPAPSPRRPPPPSAPPPHPSPDSSPATSSGRFPKLNPFLRQLRAAPPRRQLSSPNFAARGPARRPGGDGGREGGSGGHVAPRSRGRSRRRRGRGVHTAGALGRRPPAWGSGPAHASPPPRGPPGPPLPAKVRDRGDGGRHCRRGRGRQGDVSLPARPGPARPGPGAPTARPRAAAAGPGQVSYLQPETREEEREGRSRSRRRRGTGRERSRPSLRQEAAPQAAAGASIPTLPAPSAVRSGRSLAACARVESWHFLPRSWRTAPSAGITASCLPHPGQPFIEPPFPIGSHPATPLAAGQSERRRPSRGGAHWAGRRASASANGRGEELRGAAGAGPGRGAGPRGAALGPYAGAERGGAGRGRYARPHAREGAPAGPAHSGLLPCARAPTRARLWAGGAAEVRIQEVLRPCPWPARG
ncbi:unnamed protein product [Rangifer tarandus platyrhynchus]|uniref:Basic proline-rich protein-like n=2 Tax=Rangifer tarandus platyrhynchus TaxID=3082113 RepID=A0ABN8XY92_RANTA|nr:unnamed protein product [Rangifer tarandus platyrhynchus]CAI9713352.1 unnamed protein product [Rangifer tarandus platyrhynchus]